MNFESTTRRGVLALVGTAAVAGCTGFFGPDFPKDGDPPSEVHEELVTEFVELVHDGNYEAAQELFSAELAAEFPASEIDETWADLRELLGEYQGIDRMVREETDGIDEVFVRVEMTAGAYDLQVAVDETNSIAGVHIIDVHE